jgi:hypothetical protein
MVPESTAGWLPVEIGFDLRPAVVQEALVRWMEFGSAPLAEPFVDNTVDRLRAATPPAREIDTDIDTLLRVSARLPEVRPAGFIFHLSHCGSTLVANAMKMSDRAVVVSESRPVTHVLRGRTQTLSPYLREGWDRTRRKLLNSLFSLYAHYRTGEPEPLVIKFVSLDTLSMPLVRSYWPDVPCVVVIRDPVEVMVTNLKGRGWMAFKDRPEFATQLFGWTNLPRPAGEMVDEEFCARVLGSFCTSALQAIPEGRDEKCMVVDYLDLSPDRMRQIAAFFGIELRDGGKAVDVVFESYAKDPKKVVRFRDDRERKQNLATVLTRSAANQWAMSAYTELRKRRRLEGESGALNGR